MTLARWLILLGAIVLFCGAIAHCIGYTFFIPALVKKPIVSGILYGIAAYFFMNWVVIPLSAIGGTPRLVVNPPFINGILIHMFGVGLPSALFAAKISRR